MVFDVLTKRRRLANANAASSKRPLTYTPLPTAYRDQFNVRGGTRWHSILILIPHNQPVSNFPCDLQKFRQALTALKVMASEYSGWGRKFCLAQQQTFRISQNGANPQQIHGKGTPKFTDFFNSVGSITVKRKQNDYSAFQSVIQVKAQKNFLKQFPLCVQM